MCGEYGFECESRLVIKEVITRIYGEYVNILCGYGVGDNGIGFGDY